MPIKIETEAIFHDTISASTLVMVDFFADWCEPCKWLDLILESLEKELPIGAQIVKIDVEKFTELASNFNVRSVPVLVLFKNGQEVWRMNGFLTKEGLLDKFESFSRET